jgi:periplasmic glucans biosynthesis protein
MPAPDRRHFLTGTAAVVLTPQILGGQALAQQQPTGALAFLQAILQDGTKFEPAVVVEAARLLSKRPFLPPTTAIPEPFSGLTAETYQTIKHRSERLIWGDENRGIVLEPLHRGFLFAAPVSLSLVEDGVVKRIVYDANRYNFGKLVVPTQTTDMGFSGFKILLQGDGMREIASFQGASFFKSMARGQNSGVVARALALKTGDARGEEFPIFRAFWIERPTPDGVVIIHAIADSESATAAFRFTMRANDITIIDTEATIFARTALDHIGFGPMQATFLFAANKRRNVDDLRPAVHEASGLQMLNGRGEWLWRPLNNPEQLQVSQFMDDNPKGFGLVQRDRDFSNYQDDEQRFDLKPTLWIEPIGDWGAGSIQLIEIPTDSEVNDNVVVFWRPRAALAAGSETTLAYRQFWCWSPPEKPALAQVVSFRVGKGSSARRRRCLVEFAGDIFGDEKPAELKLSLSSSPGQIINPRILHNAARKTARVLFELDPGSETAIELRLIIEEGEKPLTETWLYRWTP